MSRLRWKDFFDRKPFFYLVDQSVDAGLKSYPSGAHKILPRRPLVRSTTSTECRWVSALLLHRTCTSHFSRLSFYLAFKHLNKKTEFILLFGAISKRFAVVDHTRTVVFNTVVIILEIFTFQERLIFNVTRLCKTTSSNLCSWADVRNSSN